MPWRDLARVLVEVSLHLWWLRFGAAHATVACMRGFVVLAALMLVVGCGSDKPPRVASTPTASATREATATPPPGRAHGPWSAPSVTAASRAPEPLRAARGWREAVTAAAGGARAIIEVTGSEDFRLRVSFRGRTRTLARYDRSDFLNPALTDVALAAAGDGSVLVAYGEGAFEGARVRALTLSRTGRFGRARTIGRTLGFADVSAGAAPDGRAVVAWATWDTGLEINVPMRVLAATRATGETRFARAQELERARKASEPAPYTQLAVTRDDALLLWKGTGPGLRAARAGARGGFGEVVRLGTGRPGAVALRADGAAVATWLHDARVYASVAAAGGLFGRPEPVSDRTRADELGASFATSGRPVVTWTTGTTRLRASRTAP